MRACFRAFHILNSGVPLKRMGEHVSPEPWVVIAYLGLVLIGIIMIAVWR
jgi:hypothetical protein